MEMTNLDNQEVLAAEQSKIQKILQILRWILILPIVIEKIGRLKYRTQKKVWGILFLLPWVIGFLLFFLWPFFQSFVYSFHKVTPGETGLTFEFIKYGNYIEAFREYSYADTLFYEHLLLSIWNLLIDVTVIIIFSLLMAVILNGKFRGRTFARAVFFIPVILNSSAVTAAMGGAENLRNLMEQSGLGLQNAFNFEQYLLEANVATGLVTFLIGSVSRIYSIISRSGVQILLFLAAIQSVPRHLYEAAKIEGATQYETFWKITLPVVSPMIIPATVYTVIDSYLISDVSRIIATVFNNPKDYGLAAAMGWIYFGSTTIFLAVVLFLLSRVVFYYDK